MVNLLDRFKAFANPNTTPTISVDELMSYSDTFVGTNFDGDKFVGGFGATEVQFIDYWTLRARSAQLFNDNLYARGLVRRIVTNEITTGLELESTPVTSLLGLEEGALDDWAERTENLYSMWSEDPTLVDWEKSKTFGAIQAAARQEAYICGDVLVLILQNNLTKLPMVQLVSGNRVQTPVDFVPRAGNEIVHGVELDKNKRQVAYHVLQADGNSKRVAAFGSRSGRRQAFLEYGTDKRLDDVRGQPLLSLILQSLKEIDRYRDSAQRKAVINSILAMYIKKTEDKPGTKPVTRSGYNKSVTVQDDQGQPRNFKLNGEVPGVVYEELQQGEEPVGFHSQGTDVNFPVFEDAIISAIAWANEIPPEIYKLSFSSNYSASQAAINEFKMLLNKQRKNFADTFCRYVYKEWFISSVLAQKIDAAGFLNSLNNPTLYDIQNAWLASDWSGAIKPSTDILKTVKGYQGMVSEGWITNARASREVSGTKFDRNIRRLKRENELKVAAARPLAEFKQEFTPEIVDEVMPESIDSNNVIQLTDINTGQEV